MLCETTVDRTPEVVKVDTLEKGDWIHYKGMSRKIASAGGVTTGYLRSFNLDGMGAVHLDSDMYIDAVKAERLKLEGDSK
jgi:hypothetical protein